MIAFICGVLVGGCLGVLAMCCLIISRDEPQFRTIEELEAQRQLEAAGFSREIL